MENPVNRIEHHLRDRQRLADIVVDELKAGAIQQMLDILHMPGDQIVKRDDLMSVIH